MFKLSKKGLNSCIFCYILLYKLHNRLIWDFVHVQQKMYRLVQICTELHRSVQTSVQGLEPLSLLAFRDLLHRCTDVFGILFSGGFNVRGFYSKVVCNLCRYLPYLVQTPAGQGFAGCTDRVHRCRLYDIFKFFGLLSYYWDCFASVSLSFCRITHYNMYRTRFYAKVILIV